MTDDFQQDDLEEVEEFAALSDGDPRRVEFERQLAGASESVRDGWDELVAENECLQASLSRVEVPAVLSGELLSIPGERPHRRLSARWGWVAAAAVLLSLVCLYLVREQVVNSRMRTVVLLAINNHMNHLEDHGALVEVDDARQLEEVLAGQVGFRVRIPQLESGLQMIGGRKCKLGTHEVAFTLWRDSVGGYSLFQFVPEHFGLPAEMSPTLVHTTEPAGEGHLAGAWVWTDGTSAYVLTGDPGTDLAQISPVEE